MIVVVSKFSLTLWNMAIGKYSYLNRICENEKCKKKIAVLFLRLSCVYELPNVQNSQKSLKFTQFFEIDCSILIFVKHIKFVPQFWKRKSCLCDNSSFSSPIIRVFHKLSTIQECQHCQLCFSSATKKSTSPMKCLNLKCNPHVPLDY